MVAPTATDNYVGTATGAHPTSLLLTYSTILTWTYDDGNTITQTQQVTNSDALAPIPDVVSLVDIIYECEATTLRNLPQRITVQVQF